MKKTKGKTEILYPCVRGGRKREKGGVDDDGRREDGRKGWRRTWGEEVDR